jgi:hypothetical protein
MGPLRRLALDRRRGADGVAAARAVLRLGLDARVLVFDVRCGAFVARTFFFDTFFGLAFLVDFTVFFDDVAFLRLDFDGRRALDFVAVFFVTFFLLTTFFLLRLLLFLAAALFAGITGLQDDSNETGDYT